MGKCVILKNFGEGQYQIEYRLNEAVILAKLDEIQKTRVKNEEKRVETALKLPEAVLAQKVLDLQVIAILNSTTLTPPEKNEQARIATAAQRAQRLVIVALESELAYLAMEKTSLMLQEQRYKNVITRSEKTVWSADYSPDLEIAGNEVGTLGIIGDEVGTLEVMGDEREILLQPANNQLRPWDGATDGEMTPVLAQAPMEWLLSTCLVTGWQRYLPTYRFAKVLEIIDQDRLKIALIEPKKSLYGDVDVTPINADQSPVVYTDVPCHYLNCNTRAFSVGDEVVVHYQKQNPAKAEVIGFRRDPEPCAAINFYAINERERYAPKIESWKVRPKTEAVFGGCYWIGEHEAVSWRGWRTRYLASDDPFDSPSLYYRGRNYGPLPGVVLGGCVREQHLFAVCRVGNREVLYVRPIAGTAPRWTALTNVDAADWATLTPWYFSASGWQAASAKFTAGGTTLVRLTVSALPPWSGSFVVGTEQPTLNTVEGGTLVTTERSIAVDYIGEDLVRFDRRSESLTEVFVGGFDQRETNRIYIRCGAVNLNYLHFSSVLTLETIGINLFRFVNTLSTAEGVEHVNVSGGSTRVASVTRAVTGTFITISDFGTTGSPSSMTIVTKQQITARSGTVRIRSRELSSSAYGTSLFSSPTLSDNFVALSLLFTPGIVSLLSYTACDRAGHLICSAPLTQETLAMPALPKASILRSRGGVPMGVG